LRLPSWRASTDGYVGRGRTYVFGAAGEIA
jgi:hypothetical protein